MALLSAAVGLAPVARADGTGDLRDAVATARSAATCGSLTYNPLLEQAAVIFNQATDDWIAHTGKRMPVTDAGPALQDLGYTGTKSILLTGAGHNGADAIKGALLQGYAAIPDCAYTEFGVSLQRDDAVDYDFAAIVLASP